MFNPSLAGLGENGSKPHSPAVEHLTIARAGGLRSLYDVVPVQARQADQAAATIDKG